MSQSIRNTILHRILPIAAIVMAALVAPRLFAMPSDAVTATPTPAGSQCGPADIVISIDRSGSMQSELPTAKDAALAFVDIVENGFHADISDKTRISVVSFGRSLWPTDDGMPFPPGVTPYPKPSSNTSTLHQTLTSDYSKVRSAINSIEYIGGGSCLNCGLYLANQELLRNMDNSSSVRNVVIFMSDGRANRDWDGSSDSALSRQLTIDQANYGRTQGLEYYSINFGDENDQVMLQVADNPDAKYHLHTPSSAFWKDAFLEIYEKVCQDSPTLTPAITNTPTVTKTPTATPTTTPTKTMTPTPTPPPYCTQGTSITLPALPTATTTPMPRAKLSLSAPATATYSATLASTFTVTATLDTDGADTSGTDLVVKYNPAVITLTSITKGSLYASYTQAVIDNTAGKTQIGVHAIPPLPPFKH